MGKSSSCSIQVLNSRIHSYQDPIDLACSSLTVLLIGSTFFSCYVALSSVVIYDYNHYNRKSSFNVCIDRCTFEPAETKSCFTIVRIVPAIAAYNVTVKSSKFLNFHGWSSALSIVDTFASWNTLIVLDRLRFENVSCNGVVSISLREKNDKQLFDVGIYNSVFVNTTRAFVGDIQTSSRKKRILSKNPVKVYNNTFNTTHDVSGNDGVVYLSSGPYHFSLCHFFHQLPMSNPDYPLIRVESSVAVTFENCYYESYPVAQGGREGNVLNSNLFYIISYESDTKAVAFEGNLTIICPPGYAVNLKKTCFQNRNVTDCYLFVASCEQCPPKTYSLSKGIIQKTWPNHITCHDCPVGGCCTKGQMTSKPNFWGYRLNRTVKFLQCPPKYCCETGECERYYSCHGNRVGILCGKCPSGMTESLFDTKCKMNEGCTGVTFWPGISAYLIFYLLFFLYQEDIISFLQRHVIPSCFLPSNKGRNFKPGGFLKIIFYYYQAANLLRNSVGIDKKVNFFYDMENFLFRALNFLIINIPCFDCPFQDLRAVEKTIVVHSVGYSLLIFLCLLYLSTYLFKILRKFRTRSTQQTDSYTRTMNHGRGVNEDPFLGRMAGTFVNISLLMYASSTQLCLLLLRCVPVREKQVLFLDGNIKCYKTFQYFLFAYLISSILPFCLVPVLSSYLLELGRIGVKQFCAGCLFPLPVCCYWTYLFVRESARWNKLYRCMKAKESAAPQMDEDHVEDDVIDKNSVDLVASDSSKVAHGNLISEAELRCSKSAILGVLLGPFRPHKASFIFPSSYLPWEGFLILRRLALIVVLTFVYDNRAKAMLSLILCVAILLAHVFVWPFKTTSDNVLETLSLGSLVIMSGFCLIKSVYYGQDLDSSSWSFLKIINLVESLLIVFPVALILSLAFFSILLKFVMKLRLCLQALFQRLRMFKRRSSVDCSNEE